jgi:hypothetical protein
VVVLHPGRLLLTPANVVQLSVLRWFIREDDQDLAIWILEHFTRIVREMVVRAI